MGSRLTVRIAGLVLALLVFPFWVSLAAAAPLSLNASLTSSTTGPYASGDAVVVAVSINDAVSFNSLESILTWDPNVLVPLNLVSSSDDFLTLSFPATGIIPSTFVAGNYDAAAGDSSFYVIIQQDPSLDPAVLVNGPGELFRLAFQVKSGVTLPSSTTIGFGALDPTLGSLGLAVIQTYLPPDPPQFPDPELLDPPLIYATTPQALNITFKTQQAPEPASFYLLLAGLGSMVRFTRKGLPQ